MLRSIAVTLQKSLRASDILCRFGGEEFILILPETSKEAAFDKSEMLRQAVESLVLEHRGRALGTITLSLGLAMFPEHSDSASLMRAADVALYQAKAGGRNRIAIWSDSAVAIES